MAHPIFDTTRHEDLSSKIVVGLERVAEAFKSMLWEQAKTHGLSPIQIRILIFVAYHTSEINNVSYLAKEFNVTKPTISDAVRVMFAKGLIEKETDPLDSRSYTIYLSDAGKNVVHSTQNFAQPMANEMNKIPQSDLTAMYTILVKLIHNLNRVGILNVQRTCFNCKFYESKNNKHFCHFLKQKILNKELRLDCPEYMDKDMG